MLFLCALRIHSDARLWQPKQAELFTVPYRSHRSDLASSHRHADLRVFIDPLRFPNLWRCRLYGQRVFAPRKYFLASVMGSHDLIHVLMECCLVVHLDGIVLLRRFPCLLLAIRANPAWGLVIAIAPLVTIAVINHFIQLPVETGVFGVSVTTLLYAFPVSRLFEFVLGMMSYVGWQRWLQSQGAGSDWKIELAMVGLWVGWFGWVFGPIQSTLAPYPVAYQWFGQAGSCFLFALTIAVFASGSGSLVKILSHRRLVQLGEISFALYMVHQIIMKWFVVQIPDLASPLLVLGSCLIAGTIVHYGIEVPLRHTVVRRYERFRLAAAPSV